LRCLRATSSTGPDGIPNILLKKLCGQLALPLSHIFTISFNSQQVPDDWKHAHVKPLFKNGVASDPNNYRPISLTSTCCRFMERIINKELIDYLLDKSLVSKEQHGFIRRRSTCSNLLECLQDWMLSIDNKRITDVIYIDFKKAFDQVSHNKLLLKLNSYGITGDLYGWIKSFLSNRTQAVKLDGCLSSVIAILSGVPQGSVLGPILFVLFINDLVDCFKNLAVSTKLFADDLKLYTSYGLTDSSCDLTEALHRVTVWAKKWQLTINSTKCNVLRIVNPRCKNKSDIVYDLNGSSLKVLSVVKDLGVAVDKNLRFDNHISSVVHKSLQRANLILKCFQSRDRSLLMKAFKVYVRPLLEYATPVWSPHFMYLILKIEQVQRSFTKRLFGLKI
jgi:hypothetical protein